MISYFHSILLGVIQGLTEFLPISSSAHLIIAPRFFKFADPGLTFDVALHLGTTFAIIGYYWKKWLKLVNKGFTDTKSDDGRLFWIIFFSTIPAGLAGYFFEDLAETVFRNPALIAATLIIIAIVLYITDIKGKNQYKLGSITLIEGLLIGIAQAIAIIPGVSRSGITIAVALSLGLKRESSANFSFLLATPIIIGAGLLKLKHIDSSFFTPEVFLGVLAAAVSGFLTIGFLLRYLKKYSFLPFCIYRVLLGIAILLFL